MENEENKVVSEKSSKGFGAILGAIIIIVVILVGGWYFIFNRSERIEKNTEVLQAPIGSSTEVEDIQMELDSLNLEALDADLNL